MTYLTMRREVKRMLDFGLEGWRERREENS